MTTAATIRVSNVEHSKKDPRLYAAMNIQNDGLAGLCC